MSGPGEGYKYWAFISYSHRDRFWGNWLHRRLESFPVPKALVAKSPFRAELPERLSPVFRDQEELPTSSSLGDQINAALRVSRFLIVICSPDAARSRWVEQEILEFKRLGRADRILALVVRGEPNVSDKPDSAQEECFPAGLRFTLGSDRELGPDRVEPIAADLRPGHDTRRDAFLRIAAGLLGIGFDDLKQRELRRRHRRMLFVIGLTTVLTLLMTGLAVTAWLAKLEAQRQQRVATRTLSRSDFIQASRLLEEADASAAMAHLARAVRVDPENHAAADLMLSELIWANWPQPLALPIACGDGIAQAVLSRDGRRLVKALSTGEIVTEKTGDRSIVSRFRGRDAEPTGIVLDDSGRFAAIRYRDGVQAFDLGSGKAVSEFRPGTETGGALDITLSPGGDYFVICSTGGGEILNVKSGERSSIDGDSDDQTDTWVFHPDGRRILRVTIEEAQMWEFADGARGEPAGPAFELGSPVGLARFSADGGKLATALWNNQVRLWDPLKGKPLGEPIKLDDEFGALAFSPDGLWIVVAAGNRARVYNATTGAAASEWMNHTGRVRDVQFSEGRVRTLFQDGSGLSLADWDVRPGGAVAEDLTKPGPTMLSRDSERLMHLSDDRFTVSSMTSGEPVFEFELPAGSGLIATDRTGRFVATGPLRTSGEWELRIWDIERGVVAGGRKVRSGALLLVDFGPSGQVLTCVGDEVTMGVIGDRGWTSEPLKHPGRVAAVAFDPEGEIAVCGCSDGSVLFWRFGREPGKEGGSLAMPGGVRLLAVSPRGDRLVVVSLDNELQLYDFETRLPILSHPVRSETQINAIVFSEDGSRFASVSGVYGGAGQLVIRDAATGVAVAPPVNQPEGILAAAFSPDGGKIATGSYDGGVRVWDSEGGLPVSRIFFHGEPVGVVAFRAKGQGLVTIAASGIARNWALPTATGAAPPTCADLAEAASLARLNDFGAVEPLSIADAIERRRRLPGQSRRDEGLILRCFSWFFADRSSRSPHGPPADIRP